MRIPVLLYHKISKPRPDTRIRGAFTPPRRFQKQMAYLKRQGFVFYTASDLVKHFEQHGEFPKGGVALTFDDGWKDNYTNAFPVLKELGIKATIFIIPSSIGQMSSGASAEGEKPHEHMSDGEILEMSRAGIEFGSHTMTHRLLNQIPEPEIVSEVTKAKQAIENLVQQTCWTLAYPGGFVTEPARQAVAQAGHIGAFSTVYGPEDRVDLFALNRIEVLRRDRFTYQFARKVAPLQ
ncbi:MAG TPA: polysaccharide deacetylase family protein [Pyrinomonadaceae bacterium]|nr:polysaccharide deacetylase family protein [Pyrinomonadaceae bacterium]